MTTISSKDADKTTKKRAVPAPTSELLYKMKLLGARCTIFHAISYMVKKRKLRQTPELPSLSFSQFSAIARATCTPLADAWDRECVMPLPSPMMYRPS